MYSREEAKQIRREFWQRFENYSTIRRRQKGKPARWMMNKTGIRQLKLKFHFDTEHALTGIDIETRNMDVRIALFNALEELSARLEETMGTRLEWELEHILPSGKSISRISVKMQGVNLYNRDDWPDVFKFFYRNMMKLEAFYEEYADLLKHSR